ncbi:MAG: alcohol dehydrogenase-like regulatory protein ErcA [Fidelibacterota bacterium]
MKNFNKLQLRKFLMPELVFGNGASELAGTYCKNFNVSRVLIVTDKNLVAIGLMKSLISSLTAANIEYVIFDEVTPNPRATEVMKGAQIFNSGKCEAIIAFGGGSPMDTAKAIGIVALNGGHIMDYEGINKIVSPLPPLIFIPTTAGTASDVSQFSIIINMQNRRKIAIISKVIIPDISLVDPELTISMDNYLTACTGIDALTHAIEAYVSITHSPLSDLHALKAIDLLNRYLPKILSQPKNSLIRGKIMFASTEAGLAFSNAMLGAIHAMSHSLGGHLDLPHGECNSLLLEHVVKFNFRESPDRFGKIAEAMNISTKNLTQKETEIKLFDRIRRLKQELGVTNTLKNLGVRKADIPVLSKKAVKDACLLTNPRKATQQDIEVIYEEAF